ncbi:MAG: HXXEE domain-containing protein [Pseudomonadota bacterium]
MNDRIAMLSLAVFYAALWLPLGQQAFLAEHWMKIGTYAAPLLLFVAFTARDPADPPRLDDVRLVAVVMAAAYMAHQYEEHWIDLLGRVYPLRQVLNDMLSAAYGPEAASAMTPEALFIINTSIVWLIALLAVLRAEAQVFPALAMAGIMAVNGTGHIVAALVSLSYNPGLLTGILLFLPLSLAFYATLLRRGMATFAMVAAAIGWAVAAHVLLFAGALAANVLGLIPVGLYYAMLIGFGILPLALFRSQGGARMARP